MKAISGFLAFSFLQSALASCPDLSGLYEFTGFQDNKCHTFRAHSGYSTPLPIGLEVHSGDRVRIIQDGCLTISLIYPDHRTSPAGEINRPLRLDTLRTTSRRISYSASREERLSGFGYFSGNSSYHWSLSLTDQNDLQIRYRTSISGMMNASPYLELARSRCILKRVQ
ncbi:MAG: hypothetical protein KGP28_09705 [Bdellovibrionales bacterium]|nr:hypothetical protein [Bdellovibrionales bacterium]